MTTLDFFLEREKRIASELKAAKLQAWREFIARIVSTRVDDPEPDLEEAKETND